jgi:hypothetical protein
MKVESERETMNGMKGGNPRELRSSTCLIIASSSGLVSFFMLGWQSRREAFPASQSRSVDSGTLYVPAARHTSGICLLLIAEIARRIAASLQGN